MKHLILAAAILFSSCASADPLNIQIKITDTKIVQLNHFPQAEKEFTEAPSQGEPDYSKGIHDFKDLGMANVPVLDQGQYGTCVTFATTAAIGAILKQGDFISQQCALDVMLGLGENYWNGAMYPSQIVTPLQKYGVIAKQKCPRQYPVPYSYISTAQYSKLSDVASSPIVKNVKINYLAAPSLDVVKKAIDNGHRVLIAFTVDGNSAEAVRGFNLNMNGKVYQGGLWACKQGNSSNHCVSSNAGHEVLVIGYDDAQQLLKIRNSWNVDVGYSGDYFMTYKFFQTMGADQTEIW